MLGALIAASVGGALALAGVFITIRANAAQIAKQLSHENTQQQKELLRERGEELYALTEKWLLAMFGHSIRRTYVMRGRMTYQQCIDGDIADGTENKFDAFRIQMIIDIYFPDLRGAYDQVVSARTELNEIDLQHRRGYDAGDQDGQRFLTQYLAAQRRIETTGREMQKLIVQAIRAI